MAEGNISYTPSLRDRLQLVQESWRKRGYNPMAIPRLRKVTLNVGFGSEIGNNPKVIQNVELMLSSISGQKPAITKAKKAIAAFKLKANQPIGAMVTLRGSRMLDFLDLLIVCALPRVKDFRGLPRNGFDSRGNYNFGIKDCSVFPVVPFEKLDKIRGLDVSISIHSSGPEESFRFLSDLGFPFRKS